LGSAQIHATADQGSCTVDGLDYDSGVDFANFDSMGDWAAFGDCGLPDVAAGDPHSDSQNGGVVAHFDCLQVSDDLAGGFNTPPIVCPLEWDVLGGLTMFRRKSKISRIIGAATTLVSLVTLTMKLVKMLKDTRVEREREQKLDERLSSSMDASDPVAVY
jgi:hypothetical protein